jgi:hypothetical protein
MKIIILICCVLPIFSFQQCEVFSFEPLKQKMCANCKYFKKNYFSVNHLGKCSLFPLEKTNHYLIDVPAIRTDADYTYCSIARGSEYMCGKKGDLFIKKKGL